jgi:hypothetical protein
MKFFFIFANQIQDADEFVHIPSVVVVRCDPLPLVVHQPAMPIDVQFVRDD